MRHRSAACCGASAGTLQEMRDQFKPLMHTIFLAWRHCHSSTLAKRLQTLFKRIAYAAEPHLHPSVVSEAIYSTVLHRSLWPLEAFRTAFRKAGECRWAERCRVE